MLMKITLNCSHDWFLDFCSSEAFLKSHIYVLFHIAIYFFLCRVQKNSIEQCVQAMINMLETENETNRWVYTASLLYSSLIIFIQFIPVSVLRISCPP